MAEDVGDLVAKLHLDIADFMAKLAVARGELALLKGGMNDTNTVTRDSAKAFGFLDGAVNSINGVLGQSVPIFGFFSVSVGALPALFVAAAVAIIAFTDVLGAAIAVVADLVAPLTLVATLLGGLGAAFAYVTMQSFKNKASLKDQKDALLALHVAQQTYNQDLAKYGANATQTENALLALHKAQDKYDQAQQGVALGAVHLDAKFQTLIATLTKDFAPIILSGAKALGVFLDYLNKIAQMPLDKAFKDFSVHGVEMIGDFADAVGRLVAKPIRLAFSVAFRSGGMQKMVADWWHDFTGFLFGYTQTHQAHIGRFLGPMTKTQVDGIFQPLINWFNRHNFTKQGQKIGHEILNGITGSGAANRLGQLFVSAFWDAIKIVGRDIWELFQNSGKWAMQFTITAAHWIHDKLGQAWDWIRTKAAHILTVIGNKIQTGASDAYTWITTQLGNAWDWVKKKFDGIWSSIKSAIESPLSINLSMPSLPSLSSLVPNFATGGVVPGPVGAATLAVVHGGETITPHGATRDSGGGLGPIVLHVDGRVLASATLNHMRQMQRQGTRLGLNING